MKKPVYTSKVYKCPKVRDVFDFTFPDLADLYLVEKSSSLGLSPLFKDNAA